MSSRSAYCYPTALPFARIALVFSDFATLTLEILNFTKVTPRDNRRAIREKCAFGIHRACESETKWLVKTCCELTQRNYNVGSANLPRVDTLQLKFRKRAFLISENFRAPRSPRSPVGKRAESHGLPNSIFPKNI